MPQYLLSAHTVDGEARVAGLLRRGDWLDAELARRPLLADVATWPELNTGLSALIRAFPARGQASP